MFDCPSGISSSRPSWTITHILSLSSSSIQESPAAASIGNPTVSASACVDSLVDKARSPLSSMSMISVLVVLHKSSVGGQAFSSALTSFIHCWIFKGLCLNTSSSNFAVAASVVFKLPQFVGAAGVSSAAANAVSVKGVRDPINIRLIVRNFNIFIIFIKRL